MRIAQGVQNGAPIFLFHAYNQIPHVCTLIICLFLNIAGDIQHQLKETYKTKFGKKMIFPWSLDEHTCTTNLPIVMKVLEEDNPVVYERGKLVKSVSDLFAIQDSAKKVCRQILLHGNAGTGKTTFISQIAYQWSKASGDDAETTENLPMYLGRFEFVFVISCYKLKMGADIVDTIKDQYFPSVSKEDIEESLDQSQCLFLIDGYDELPSNLESDVEFLKHPLLEKNFVIVTSRSSEVKKFCLDHPKFVRVSVVGIAVSHIHSFIESFFAHQPEMADALIAEINENQSMQMIASIPMMLPLVCIIWQKQETQSRSLQITHVVQAMIKYMSEQMQTMKETEELDIDAVLRRVGKVAIRSLFDSEICMEEKQFSKDDLECVLKLGLVQRDISSQQAPHITFVHRVFQEYCAAVFLSSLYELEKERFILYVQKLTKKNAVSFKYLIQFCCGLEPSAITIIAPHLLKMSGSSIPDYQRSLFLAQSIESPVKASLCFSTMSETIDSQGGDVTLSDVDAVLKIPQNAVMEPTLVSVTIDATVGHPALDDDQLILGPVISCKPDGQKFLKPVTIVVPHSGVNVTERCLQVWCKTTGSESWQKIYDGSTNFVQDDISVRVEGYKIKLRVKHFTLFDFVTAPITALSNWLTPPELALDILVYMYPVNIETCRNVCLRVYAVKKHDAASKKMVEEREEREERNPANTKSGMCCIPSAFILKQNGKGLEIYVKITFPQGRWVTVEGCKGHISYANIQGGGTGSRCEIMYLPKDEQPPVQFEGCFGIEQEGNPDNTVERIHFYDSMAKDNSGTHQNPEAERPQEASKRPQEASSRSALERPVIPRHQPCASTSLSVNKYQVGDETKTQHNSKPSRMA